MATVKQIVGVYSIEHISGKRYIGSSTNLKRRNKQHVRALRSGRHINSHLQSAWNKYGDDEFTFSVLLLCEIKDMLFYEQRAIDIYEAAGAGGFNKSPTAGSTFGYKHSDEYKKALSKRMTGRKLSEETKTLIGAGRIGHRHTNEAKEKIRQSKIGMKHTPETRENISAAKKGNSLSEETKRKIGLAHLGNQYNKGRKHSPEVRARVSAAVTAWWANRKQGELSSLP